MCLNRRARRGEEAVWELASDQPSGAPLACQTIGELEMPLDAENRIHRKEADEKLAKSAHGFSLTLIKSVGSFSSGR
jgi:hypothetical protein